MNIKELLAVCEYGMMGKKRGASCLEMRSVHMPRWFERYQQGFYQEVYDELLLMQKPKQSTIEQGYALGTIPATNRLLE